MVEVDKRRFWMKLKRLISSRVANYAEAWAANRLYQLIGRIADVTITVTPQFGLDRITVTEVPNAAFLPNDVIVPRRSAARYPQYPITGWHHLNVHAQVNAETIARDAQTPGLVDWRAR